MVRWGIGAWLALWGVFAVLAHAASPRSYNSTDNSVAYRLNPAHTNSINFSSGFSSSLKLAWTSQAYPGNFFLNSIVADGTVFVVERVESNSDDDILHALRLSDGHELWYKKFKRRIGSGYGAPAYDNGSVFVVDENNNLYSLSAATGRKQWSVRLPKEYDANSDPVVANGQVFSSADGNINYSLVYATDEASGSLQWSGKLNYGGFGSPAYDGNGGVYMAPTSNYYKFDAATGARLWYDDPYGDHGGGGLTPVYMHGKLFVQDVVSPYIVILDSGTGKQVGQYPAFSGTPPAFYTDAKGVDRGVTVGGNDENTLSNWKVSTGKTLWQYTPTTDGMLGTAPIVINGIVFFGLSGGYVGSVDADSGTPLATWQLPLNCEGRKCFPWPELTAGDGALLADGGAELFAYIPQ